MKSITEVRYSTRTASLAFFAAMASRRSLLAVARLPHLQVRPGSALLARMYYSPTAPAKPSPYTPLEQTILHEALTRQVPTHGFSTASLSLAAQSQGYSPALASSLFPHGGALDLVLYHLFTARQALESTFGPVGATSDSTSAAPPAAASEPRSTSPSLREIIMYRLRLNDPILAQLPQALSLLTGPRNVPIATRELFTLSSQILYLANPVPLERPAEPALVTGRWYSSRAGVAGIYAAAERFMARDRSAGFKDTARFVTRGLERGETVRGWADNVAEWTGGSARGLVNVLRSKGMRS